VRWPLDLLRFPSTGVRDRTGNFFGLTLKRQITADSTMDLAELLMSEHVSLRIYFRHLRDMKFDSFFELDDFVVNCHSKLEDDAMFPALVEGVPNPLVSRTTKRLRDEHEVLKMLSNSIRVTMAEEKTELDKNKVALYADTLESHNISEEKTVFKDWKELNEKEKQRASTQASEIIRSFGLERYLRITGFSQEFLSSLQ
jgi:hemerythrin superfamily protein